MAKSLKKLPVAGTSNAQQGIDVKRSSEDDARERRYRAESDMETMQRAEEIKKDKDRMKAMKSVTKEKIKLMSKIC